MTFSLSLLFSACKKTNLQYWENGTKKSEITFLNGKMDGKATWWYDSGTIQQSSYYKKDKLNGLSVRYYFNGKKQSEENYIDDKLNGLCTYYDENGVKLTEVNYKDGIKDGLCIQWHNNGQMKFKGYYLKDKFDKKWIYWNPIGMKVGEADFVNGTGTQMAYFYNGKKMREIHYINNQKDGIEKAWDIDGKLQFEKNYKAGKILNEKIYSEQEVKKIIHD